MTLNFEEPPHDGPTVVKIPYGNGRAKLGYAAPCKRHCDPPCPCSVHIVPSSYDVDERERIWVLDSAKQRVAVYDEAGAFLFAVHNDDIDAGTLDLQRLASQSAVLGQENFNQLLVLIEENNLAVSHDISFEGEKAETDSQLVTDDAALFTQAWVNEPTDHPIPVRLEIPDSAEEDVVASEVEGRPFQDGWLDYPAFIADRVIPLRVTSSQQDWYRELHFKLKKEIDGDLVKRKGTVSVEIEVDAAGVLHLLLYAGTYGRGSESGYWYLRVAADGTVGVPSRLKGENKPDDQQVRHLTLDASGQPWLMWTGGKNERFQLAPDL